MEAPDTRNVFLIALLVAASGGGGVLVRDVLTPDAKHASELKESILRDIHAAKVEEERSKRDQSIDYRILLLEEEIAKLKRIQENFTGPRQ